MLELQLDPHLKVGGFDLPTVLSSFAGAVENQGETERQSTEAEALGLTFLSLNLRQVL